MRSSPMTLRVAAVQLESSNGEIEHNLERGTPLVAEAAGRGAKLVLLPEFFATGYEYSKKIWQAAEPREGPTVRWLRELSARHDIYVGASFLEAEGEDFFNTFVLTRPDGTDAGRVRKQTPAAFEAFFTRGEDGPHVIETEIGRLGIGICHETQLAYTPRRLQTDNVDLVLMPHSAPSPQRGRPLSSRAVDDYESGLRMLPMYYAEMLGVPVVMANKSGPWRTTLPGLRFLRQDSYFPGLSAIADSDGTLKGQLEADSGVLVEDVVLDSARKKPGEPVCHGRWSMKVPWTANLFRLAAFAGSAWYGRSKERRASARRVSGDATHVDR